MIKNSGWQYYPLSEACVICDSNRKPVNTKERTKRIEGKKLADLFPYYGATGQVGYIDDYLIDGEYVLLGEDGAPFLNTFAQKAYLISGKSWVNNHAHILQSKTDNRFLCYYLNCFDYKGYVCGTTRLKLTQGQMKSIPVPVPPIEEQQRIVTRIEELFSELDSAVETLQKTKQQLAVYRQAVLKVAFDSIGEFVPFGNIIESRLGKMLDKEKNNGNPELYLRNINVRWFSFDLSNLLEMRIEPVEFEKYSLKCGDLVVCEGGEPGRCAVWDKDSTIYYQKALHRIRFTNGSNPKFYMYYLWLATKTGRLSPFYTGTGIKHLTGQSLVKIPVPICSRTIQDRLVLQIEYKLSVSENIEKTIKEALQQAEAMRQSILKKAFEGRL